MRSQKSYRGLTPGACIYGEYGKRIEFFRTPDGAVFADIYLDAIRQTWPVQSKWFFQWLARTYLENTGKIAAVGQLKATTNQIEAQAQLDYPEREVFRRVGQHGGRAYLDLADAEWSAIEIDGTGWRVVQNPPLRFLRKPGMLALPLPERGGSVEAFRSLVNLANDDFILVVAWLLGAMHPKIPKPILAIRGGEGSAKSTLVEILRGLIDPHEPPYTALPVTDLKLRSAAAEAYCLAHDNVSGLKLTMSDALCRFVTDGRNQPVVINGISDIIARADVADRCLFIDCAPIPDAHRRTHAEIMTTFAKARPKILGALLEAVAQGLRTQTKIGSTGLPRMADFALAVTACETTFWPAGTFRAAYDTNRAEIVDALIEANPVAAAVRSLVLKRKSWEGQASDLDNVLRAITGNTEGTKGWPADPRNLANTLRQLAPSLMKIGIDVKFHKSRGRDRNRLILITAINTDAANKEGAISASAGSGPENSVPRHPYWNDANGNGRNGAAPNALFDLPTAEGLAATLDAADAAEADKPELLKAVPPKVRPEDGKNTLTGVKNRSVEFVETRVAGGKRLTLLRHRTPRSTNKAGLSINTVLRPNTK